jgi:hypothetical protein
MKSTTARNDPGLSLRNRSPVGVNAKVSGWGSEQTPTDLPEEGF